MRSADRRMDLLAGTSGFAYKEWKGAFYPEDLPDRERLTYYSRQLKAVEINNTFYRMPRAELLESWSRQTPRDFRFTLKASRKITHFKKLKDCREEARYLLSAAGGLGAKLGAVLFQLPPKLSKEVERLEEFLRQLPCDARASFEFRHPSWLDEDVYALLRQHNCALCLADTAAGEPPRVATADWGYLRLRRDDYRDDDLEDWIGWARRQEWSEVFVFFKHEDAAAGPRLAHRAVQLFAAAADSVGR